MKKVFIEVNLSTIKEGKSELLMLEAKDYLENGKTNTINLSSNIVLSAQEEIIKIKLRIMGKKEEEK